jgi:hypothetical protein
MNTDVNDSFKKIYKEKRDYDLDRLDQLIEIIGEYRCHWNHRNYLISQLIR